MFSLQILEVKLTALEMTYTEGTPFPRECCVLFPAKFKGAPKGEGGPV